MRINRIAVGCIGGLVGIAATAAVAYLKVRQFGLLDWLLDWEQVLVVGILTGFSVLWLADRLGVLAEPTAHANLLRAEEAPEAGVSERGRDARGASVGR